MGRPVLKLFNSDLTGNKNKPYGHFCKPPYELLSFISENFELSEIKLCMGDNMNCISIKICSESPMYVDLQRESDVYLSKISINIYSGAPNQIIIGLDQYDFGVSHKDDANIIDTSYSFSTSRDGKFMSTTLKLIKEQIDNINTLCNLNF